MTNFETKVQELKYDVLKEVAKKTWNEKINNDIDKKDENENIKENVNVIKVIEEACNKCPNSGYVVTNACQGCVNRSCMASCPKDAIKIDNEGHVFIDKNKCINCGRCASSCAYNAIVNQKRPCITSCIPKAMNENKDNKCASINNEKCTACGACIKSCPFGAIVDMSYIKDAIKVLKESDNNKKYKTYAIVAPSIISQFNYPIEKVIAGIKKMGFSEVVEAALGADMVALSEAKELKEKGFLISSCCPAFVSYVKKEFPELEKNISTNLSPAATIAKVIKENDEGAKIIFIGPCTAKKMEFKNTKAKEYVDVTLTFEELNAMFDARCDINFEEIKFFENQKEKENENKNSIFNDGSFYGRGFARSGGLIDAIKRSLIELEIKDFEFKPVKCDGLESCKKELLKAKMGKLNGNFIEGMACTCGCIGGPCALSHKLENINLVIEYGKKSSKQNIKMQNKKDVKESNMIALKKAS